MIANGTSGRVARSNVASLARMACENRGIPERARQNVAVDCSHMNIAKLREVCAPGHDSAQQDGLNEPHQPCTNNVVDFGGPNSKEPDMWPKRYMNASVRSV